MSNFDDEEFYDSDLEDAKTSVRSKLEEDGDGATAKAFLEIEKEIRRQRYRQALLNEDV